jgi:glycosyltransferase involved in cell wall biosynthesis
MKVTFDQRRLTHSFSMSTSRVVIAVPCHNTQSTIADVVTGAKKFVEEVIVIDDGSSDLTGNSARSAGAIVIHHEVNKGYGEAIKSCFKAALDNRADVLITIDGDGQHDPNDIPLILNSLIEDGVDLVIGSRSLAEWQEVPRYRRLGINIINFLWNFGLKVKVSDTQSGFRAYSKKAIENLTLSETGMSISIEILDEIRRKKLTLREVPITCSYKNNNSSLSIKTFLHGLGVSMSVIRIRGKYEIYKRKN